MVRAQDFSKNIHSSWTYVYVEAMIKIRLFYTYKRIKIIHLVGVVRIRSLEKWKLEMSIKIWTCQPKKSKI